MMAGGSRGGGGPETTRSASGQRAASELEAKKARLARLETDITNMLKVDLLKREVHEARQTVEVARGEYETNQGAARRRI
jgi:acyl-CoA reductase-like NAD-dependent aldehyde dehydrogenase